MRTFRKNYFKYGQVVKEEMLFKEKVYVRLTKTRLEPSSLVNYQSGSGREKYPPNYW